MLKSGTKEGGTTIISLDMAKNDDLPIILVDKEFQEFKEAVEAMHPDEPEVQAFTTTKEEDIAVI